MKIEPKRIALIKTSLGAFAYLFGAMLALGQSDATKAQAANLDRAMLPSAVSGASQESADSEPSSPQYRKVQQHLARGWNTWDVHSVMTHVLLPEGLAIHVGLQDNTPKGPDAFLGDTPNGRHAKGAEQITLGQHAWDGSYTDVRISWMGHIWRLQSAHDGTDLVLLATPLPSNPESSFPPTIVFSVSFLWGRPGTAIQHGGYIEAQGASGRVPIYCTCKESQSPNIGDKSLAIGGPWFSRDFSQPVGISTGKRRTLAEIEQAIKRQQLAYRRSLSANRHKRCNLRCYRKYA